MEQTKRYNFKQILITSIWILLGAGTVVLLVAAINKKNSKHCNAVAINITGVQNNFFIDKKDVIDILEKISNGKLEGKSVASINLAVMEATLEKKPWIKNAELFFDNNEVLKVNVVEREPVARIFTYTGSSFYIDTAIARLPLSDKFSARVPVFTNFPAENIATTKADSNLLRDIRTISEYIFNDPFWMAQIEQIDITADRTFEMIPKIGNNIIVFGNADNYAEKFNNLLTFYKQVQTKVGWNKYSIINVQYKGQIVAVKRGAEDIKMDSLKARELMKVLVANAQRLANDSANNIQLVQPPDDNHVPLAPVITDIVPNEEVTNYSLYKPLENKSVVPQFKPATIQKPFWQTVSKPITIKPTLQTNTPKGKSNSIQKPNPPFKKPVTTKPIISKSNDKPKAVMPIKRASPKNDY